MFGFGSTHRFSHCIVIINPASTHYKKGKKRADKLQELFPARKFQLIETDKQDYEDTNRLLAKILPNLDDRTLVCIAGGDGTISLIVNLLLTRSEVPAKARQAVILPLWGGNANDFAHMINGSPGRANFAKIIKHGEIVDIHPLVVTTKRKNKTWTKLAICYVSFGASARAGHFISRPKHRSRKIYKIRSIRLLSEMLNVAMALVRSRPFITEIDGKQRRLFDLILINGSRMAKLNGLPMNITKPEFYEFRVHHKQPMVALYLLQIAAQGTAVRRKHTKTERSFTIREATWAQLDGEVQRIREYSQITVTSSAQTFRVLTTKH